MINHILYFFIKYLSQVMMYYQIEIKQIKNKTIFF